MSVFRRVGVAAKVMAAVGMFFVASQGAPATSQAQGRSEEALAEHVPNQVLVQYRAGAGENGKARLVGLTSKGVYELDPVSMEIVRTANAPVPVSCGFALTDDAVYFGSKAELWRFVLPDLRTATSK